MDQGGATVAVAGVYIACGDSRAAQATFLWHSDRRRLGPMVTKARMESDASSPGLPRRPSSTLWGHRDVLPRGSAGRPAEGAARDPDIAQRWRCLTGHFSGSE